MHGYTRRIKSIHKNFMGVFLIAASCLIMPVSSDAATQITVTGDNVNVRNGPDTRNSIVTQIKKNEKYDVLDIRGDWYKISAAAKEGWVAGWLVRAETVPDNKIAGTAIVNSNTLNIRNGPGESYSVTGQARKGEALTILDKSDDWLKVESPGGVTGWAAGWLVTISQSNTTQQEPIQQAPAQQTKQPLIGKQVTVNASSVNIRSGPGTSYEVVTKVNSGEKYTLAEVKGQWLKINLPGGKAGWIAAWLASIGGGTAQPPTTTPVNQTPQESDNNLLAVVNGNYVNVRGGPGTSHGVLSQVSRGQSLGVIEQTGDWYKVKLDGGVVGWVAGWLLNVEQAEASPSPGDPPDVTSPDEQNEGPDESEQPQEEVKLEKIEVKENDGHTLVSINSTGALNYSMFMLTGPDRLVLDLKNTDIGDLPETIEINSDAIKQLRTGWFSQDNQEPEVVRLVFDLNGAVVSLDKLTEDYRQLDLDIFIPKAGSFLAGRTIAIDPGHGGSEPGARGPTGLLEKDINLDIALKLAQILMDSGAKVIMTRSDDSYVDLYERTAIAEKNNAEVFLSIHSNANPDSSKGGTSTYYRRNSGDVAPGVSQSDNRRLSGTIQSELLRKLGRKSLGVLQANYVVLRTAPVPAALAEIAFISNYEEEQMLRQESFRYKAAEALAAGLNNYFAPNSN